MKLRLEIEVDYETEEGSSEVPESSLEALKANLLYIAEYALDNGLITQNTDHYVDTCFAQVVRCNP
jgi:hypothetical protein